MDSDHSRMLRLFSSLAQGHDWWANNVGWDGKAHWSTYLIFAPRHLGPSALPIPSLDDGRIENQHFFRASMQTHVTKGDLTMNPFLQFTYAPAPDLISFDLFMIPMEYFQMSHEKRTERRTFHYLYGRLLSVTFTCTPTFNCLASAGTPACDWATASLPPMWWDRKNNDFFTQ